MVSFKLMCHKNEPFEAMNEIELIKSSLNYDPETGLFTWNKNKTKRGMNSNGTVGTLDNRGYWAIRLNYKKYGAHRVAWLLQTGSWPKSLLDHIDGNPLNNKWNNLREVSCSQNCLNRKRRSTSLSGVKNVSWNKHRQLWIVSLFLNKKHHQFGGFKTLEEATAVAAIQRQKFHGEFAIR